jgi:hypothetical protein
MLLVITLVCVISVNGISKYADLEALCDYYKGLGINASILPDKSPEAVEQGFIKHDRGYIKVTGRNFDLVTIRTKGTKSSSSTSIGGVNIESKQKIPFEYHHIVRANVADEGALKVKLKKKTKGLLSKEIVGVSWEGGLFTTALNSDVELNASIMKFITSDDDLKIEPDKKNNLIRIVFSRPSEIRSGLVYGFKFDRNLLPKEAVDVIDKIAGLGKKEYLV